MGLGQPLALNAQFKRLAAAALIVFGFAAALAAFSVGFTGALSRSLADPASAPRLRAAALSQLDETLGYGGFLGVYRVFLFTASPMQAGELRRLASDADADVATFSRAAVATADHDYAASLQRQIAPFQRAAADAAAASQTAGAPIPAEQLDRNYAALKKTIADAADETNFARVDDLSAALSWAQAMAVGGLTALAATLLGLSWFLREYLLAPLAHLRRSISAAATGEVGSLWGIDRPDEIGALARSAERLRLREHAQMAAPIPRLHLDIVHSLAKGAATLEADIARVAAMGAAATRRIEEACLATSNASHATIEAAELARQSSFRLEQSAEALKSAPAQRHDADDAESIAARLFIVPSEQPGPATKISESAGIIRFPRAAFEEDDASVVLDALAGGLSKLENFARERRDIREDQQVSLTAAILQAVDRMNAIVYAMADSDDVVLRAAE
jgi:HAMP domain-containing protein